MDPLSSAGGRAGGLNDINWVNFNYPPLLQLIHYNLEELPTTLTGIVRSFNFSFQITVVGCLINLIDTFFIAATTEAPWNWLLLSLIHLVLLPVAALFVFYSGYRGLAEPDSQLTTRFKIGQPILGFIYFLFGLVPYGCVNGLAKLGSYTTYTDSSTFWLVIIILESILWLVNALLAGLNVVRAHRFDAYATAGSHF